LQEGHLPIHFADSTPQFWQTNTVFDFDIFLSEVILFPSIHLFLPVPSENQEEGYGTHYCYKDEL
jgi:hypothetical protein